MDVLREWLAPLLFDQALILGHQRAEVVGLELGVERVAAIFLGDVERFLERPMIEAEHHVGIHLDEAAIAVPREARVARHGGEALDRRIVEAEVEDGIHHPGHRHARAAANADQQRIGGVTELLAGDLLDMMEAQRDLRAQFVGEAFALLVIARAHRGADGESGGHGQADPRHAVEVRALAAEQVLVLPAFGHPAAEAVNVVGQIDAPQRSEVGVRC